MCHWIPQWVWRRECSISSRDFCCHYLSLFYSSTILTRCQSHQFDNLWYLQDRIRFLLCDYRQLPSTHKYDRIISWWDPLTDMTWLTAFWSLSWSLMFLLLNQWDARTSGGWVLWGFFSPVWVCFGRKWDPSHSGLQVTQWERVAPGAISFFSPFKLFIKKNHVCKPCLSLPVEGLPIYWPLEICVSLLIIRLCHVISW